MTEYRIGWCGTQKRVSVKDAGHGQNVDVNVICII